MLATEHAEYYRIPPQADGESDLAFRTRVSVELRQRGNLIEAHEAYQDERYEQSDSVMTGLIGVVAQAMAGKYYPGDPIGNDITCGVVAQHPKSTRDMTDMTSLIECLLGKTR